MAGADNRTSQQHDLFAPRAHLYDRIPSNLTPGQHARAVAKLDRMACMMVHWFADRAFTCPDSLTGTIETYKRLTLLDAHNAA